MKKLLKAAVLPLFAIMFSCQSEQDKVNNYKVNETSSSVEWKGSTPDHFHTGSFKVSGDLNANENGMITSGSFTIPIASIDNFDLQDPAKKQLLDHLKSPDFFNLAIHPNAEFKLTKVESYKGGGENVVEGANYMLTGDFSMIGQTHSISFPAKITTNTDGLQLDAKLVLNRTQWGMMSYNDPAHPMYILPNVDLKLKLFTAKAK